MCCHHFGVQEEGDGEPRPSKAHCDARPAIELSDREGHIELELASWRGRDDGWMGQQRGGKSDPEQVGIGLGRWVRGERNETATMKRRRRSQTAKLAVSWRDAKDQPAVF